MARCTLDVCDDGVEQDSQIEDQVIVGDAEIPVQKLDQLSLHEVDVFDTEQTVCVLCPVLVQGRRVVVELGT